ncbi:MAG TPA: glycosyltransferase, partial [Longimicrobiales bacterium]|nr:glycosyltransferase [Longimicrobiales bacterium]
MPRVSVLLPCRDVAAYLPEAIASLDAQTFTDFEVIAVDDGSSDNPRSMLESWAERSPRVRVIEQEPRGLVAALQNAAAAANGEIIARMDGDDVAYP